MKLEEIEKICNEATPGPWEVFNQYHQSDRSPFGIKAEPEGRRNRNVIDPDYNENPSGILQLNDAKFIAASRELMPKLLAVAKAAKFVVECYNESSRPGNGGEESLRDELEELEKE